MKIIVLILANDSGIYLECQKLWRSYMNAHPNIKSYFIKFNPNLKTNILIDNDTIFIKGSESIVPGCLNKTIESMKYLLNEDFNFIFRTNMSSVVDFNKLYNLLKYYDKDYSGVIGNYNNNIRFASGAGILLSKHMCNFLVNNCRILNYDLIDDVSIGELAQNNNITIYPLTRFEAYNYEIDISQINEEKIQDYYHFRCKSNINTSNTIILMDKIINMIYFTGQKL